jgi:cell wall-associated NlpC family hydrolase
MTKGLMTTGSRRTVTMGVGGMLLVALGATAVVAPSNSSAEMNAAIYQAPQSSVVDAVASAEAQRAAAEAARLAQEAAQAAAEAARASQQQSLVDLAYGQVGDSYSMGASGPDVFDCSGFVMWLYQQTMGVSLPHNTHAQWGAIDDTWYAGEREPQPGDVVFFFNGADHVGIYVGDGMMVHAANPRAGVTTDSIYDGYWAGRVTGFGRIIH